MQNMKRTLLCGVWAMLGTLTASAQVIVRVDCAQWEEFPLVKKIGLY